MPKSKRVLITGSTGKQGGAVARELLASKGFHIRAMTRHPESAPAQVLSNLGAEIVKGDLDDPSSLEAAVKGAWGVFGVQNTWEAGVEKEEEQGKRLAEIARKSGVQFYFYSSVGSAHRRTGIPHFDNKYRVEETVRAQQFPFHTIMRPAFFMENFLLPSFKDGIDKGTLQVALKPQTKLQMIAVQDIGKYGAWVFQNYEKLNGYAFDIAGDEIAMPEVASVLSAVTGRSIKFEQSPIEPVRAWSKDYALMLEWFDKVGYKADISARSKQAGVPPTSFETWARTIQW